MSWHSSRRCEMNGANNGQDASHTRDTLRNGCDRAHLVGCSDSEARSSGTGRGCANRTGNAGGDSCTHLMRIRIDQDAVADSGAMLYIENPRVDFGPVADYETRTAKIRFVNAGDQVLDVSRVQPTCGCVFRPSPRSFSLSEKLTEIELTFKPKGSGKQTKLVKVHTNDPINPVQTIEIKADVSATVTPPKPPNHCHSGSSRSSRVGWGSPASWRRTRTTNR